MWKHASEAYNARGLQMGTPDFGPAAKDHRSFIKQGRLDEAKALENIIVNKSWCQHHLLEAGIIEHPEATFPKSKQAVAPPPIHRDYQCRGRPAP